MLAGEGLERVLRVEGGLISEIKGLDGERKALVYDNYSKLIAATETIRRMREKMQMEEGGLGMEESLGGRVAGIAEVTRGVRERRGGGGGRRRGGRGRWFAGC